MSVRRAACGVRRPSILPGAFLGNRMPSLDDIWCVGGARAEVVHAAFWAWHMLIKYLICIIYANICPGHFSGNLMPHLDDIWYVGRARVESAHGEFWAWHMLVPWDP